MNLSSAHETMVSCGLKDEVEQLLKLLFLMFLLMYSVAQIQVISFDSHYSVVGQPDCSEQLSIPHLFHNCVCKRVCYSVRHTTV